MTTTSVIDNEKMTLLTASPTLVEELQGLLQFHKRYDAIVIDCAVEGFLFPADDLIKAMCTSSELLDTKGSLVFAKSDGILVLTKETAVGDISFHYFSSVGQLYGFSPSLARHIQRGESKPSTETDISDQIIMGTIPVLTPAGINSKAKAPSGSRRRDVLKAIDNYSSISDIAARLSTAENISVEEFKDELRYLEKDQLIFPIFPKVRFLAQCLRNGILITIKDYLVSSGLITKENLDQLLMERPSGNPETRLSLGPLCVSKEIFSSRLLEIIMYDLELYGGGSQKRADKHVNTPEQMLVQSLVGQLATTDPAGLLQSLNSEWRSGILTVECYNRQFQCVYNQGRITHAKLGDIYASDALIEFAATWNSGIFVFIQRQPRPELVSEACKLTRPLDKLLLNAALAHDNQEMVWKKLPHGIETSVEKLPDSQHLLELNDLTDMKTGQKLGARELQVMSRLWEASDGLTPISTIVRNLGNVTTTEAAYAVDYLLQMNLITIEDVNIPSALQKFRQVVRAVGELVGTERNTIMLRVSLQSTHGYTTTSRLFKIGTLGEIGLDLGAARSANFLASEILKRLEDWQVRYVESLSQEIDVESLKNIIYRAYGQTRQSSFLS